MAETDSSSTASQDGNSDSEHDLRIKTVKEEIEDLCAPIGDLINSGQLDKAIFLCRLQLTDPLAYQRGQTVATSDQLRVAGSSMLGLAIYHQYIAPNAPFPDTTRNNEVVDAFKKAAEGVVRHYDQYNDKALNLLGDFWLALTRRTDLTAIIADYEHLVHLHREVLARIMSTASVQCERHRKDLGDNVKRTSSVLDHLAGKYMEANRRLDVVKVFRDSVEVLDNYTVGLEADLDIQHCYVDLLSATGLRLEGAEQSIEETRAIFSHLEKCRTIVSANRKDKGVDVYRNENYMKIENQFAAGLFYFGRSLPLDWDGPTAVDLLWEASEGFRKLCHLPTDLSEGIPPDFHSLRLQSYVNVLHILAQKLGTYLQVLDTLERALRVYLACVDLRSSEYNTPVPLYLNLIENYDWTRLDFDRLKQVTSLLSTITETRARQVLVIREKVNNASSGMLKVLEDEAALWLRLSDTMVAVSESSQSKAEAYVERAQSLILIGKVKLYHVANPELWSQATTLWAEAIRLVRSFSATGTTEHNRKIIIDMAHELLDRAPNRDPEFLRQIITWKDSVRFWADIEGKTSSEEVVAMCRARLADPLAFISGPLVANEDELRADGLYHLASLLEDLYEDSKDPAHKLELLEAYRQAMEALKCHFPYEPSHRLWLAGRCGWSLYEFGRIQECLASFKEVIQLVEQATFAVDGAEQWRCPLLIERGRGFRLKIIETMVEEENGPKDNPRQALTMLEEVLHAIKDYESKYGETEETKRIRLAALEYKAQHLFSLHMVDDAIDVAEQAADEYVVLIQQRIQRIGVDKPTKKLNTLYVGRLVRIMCWAENSKRTSFLGRSLPEFRMDLLELCRRKLGLPVDLDMVKSPLKLDPDDLRFYHEAVCQSLEDASSKQERIHIVEKIMRILDLRMQIAAGFDPQTLQPYAKSLDYSQVEKADHLTFDPIISSLIIITRLRIEQFTGKEPSILSAEECAALVLQEAHLGLSLLDRWLKEPCIGADESICLLSKAPLLLAKGVVVGKGDKEEKERLRSEAKKIVGITEDMEMKDTPGKRDYLLHVIAELESS